MSRALKYTKNNTGLHNQIYQVRTSWFRLHRPCTQHKATCHYKHCLHHTIKDTVCLSILQSAVLRFCLAASDNCGTAMAAMVPVAVGAEFLWKQLVAKDNPDFDKPEALRYARLSQLAYRQYSKVQEELSKYGLRAKMRIYDASTNTNGFIACDDFSVVVAFRGTELKSLGNIFTDAQVVPKPIVPGEKTKAHGGFVDALNTVYESIASQLESSIGKKKLFITGHSLGGALASLLTYRISWEHRDAQPTMYVYGCPPVGDSSFAKYFQGMHSNTITIVGDPISSSSVIGSLVGLYKPGQEICLRSAVGHGISDYIKQLSK